MGELSTKSTPGPWALHQVAKDVILGPDNRPVAYAAASHMDQRDADDYSGEASANARLIAAAPDLLAALEELLRAADRYGNGFPEMMAAQRKARTAISKVGGGST